jgi:hypothetical protein
MVGKKDFVEEVDSDILSPEESEHRAERERKKPNGSPRIIWEGYVAAGNMLIGEKKYSRALGDYQDALRFGVPENEEARKNLKNKIKETEDKMRLEHFRSSSPIHKYPFAVLSIASLLAALGFVSISLTGNIIAGLEQNNSRWIGLCLFVCGLVFSFLYLKKK